jgi:hypothetical protein
MERMSEMRLFVHCGVQNRNDAGRRRRSRRRRIHASIIHYKIICTILRI